MLTIREIQQKLRRQKDILDSDWPEVEPAPQETVPVTAMDVQQEVAEEIHPDENQRPDEAALDWSEHDAPAQAVDQAPQDERETNEESKLSGQGRLQEERAPQGTYGVLQSQVQEAIQAGSPFAEPQPSEQEEEEIHTIGQMRRAIMDFPTSQAAATFFKCFSDSTRLRLLQALSIREMCVSDLCEMLELSQPAVSNHLRILNNQRIVQFRRSGKNVFYSLDEWHINAIIGMALEYLDVAFPEHAREK